MNADRQREPKGEASWCVHGVAELDMTEQLTLINYYQLPSSDCSSHNWGAIYFKKNFFKFFFFFLMWTIFKVPVKFVTTLLLFYVLVFWPQGIWDLSSLTRD